MLTKENNRLIRRYDKEIIWIEPWGENAFRVRVTQNREMDCNDWALLPQTESKAEVELSEKSASIRNGKLLAKIGEDGQISFSNDKGRLLLEEYLRTEEAAGEKRSLLKVVAREFRPSEGGNFGLTLRFESARHEKIFGMGQYQQDIMNLKGTTLELAQRNSQASVPFMVSDQGYGFLWNNPAIGSVVFGTNRTEWKAASARQMDYWITSGDTPAEIMHSYMQATGMPPMMPEYAMGFWQSKLRYKRQDEVLWTAEEYCRRNIPLSVIVIDYFHWPNQGTWEFDRSYWPEPEKMAAKLESMGIKLMVSVWPTVDSRCENYGEMLEKGYLVSTDKGVRTQMQFLGNETFYDATNEEARSYVWERVKKNYYEKGIHTFWLDVAEPEYSVYDFDIYRYSMGTNLEVGNIYPTLYAKGFYDGMRAAGDENPLNLIRCAWAGSQRYGALVWSGDIHSSFASLRAQVIAGLNMAIAGIPWWTTDIGGFNDGVTEDGDFRELLIRWFEYAAFCPVMRLHGYRLPYEEPMSAEVGGGMCDSGAANEVWSFGSRAYGILTYYIRLREKLRPYIRVLMEKAHTDGEPPMRPLFYDFPKQEQAWETEDAFMFGSHLLIAPVLREGMTEREVFLPAGRRWIDVRDKKEYEGGQNITVKAPLESIPVFTDEEKLADLFN